MYLRIAFLLLLLQVPALAQVKKERLVLATAYEYQMLEEIRSKMNLENLDASGMPLHFRLWINSHVVDIWTHDGKTFNGKLWNYTYANTMNKAPKSKVNPGDFFFSSVPIDTDAARNIYALLSLDSAFKVPTDRNAWKTKLRLDGGWRAIEYSDNSLYLYKTYDPHDLKKLTTTLHMFRSWEDFVYTLPPGHYSYAGIAGVCTQKQSFHLLRNWHINRAKARIKKKEQRS